MIKIMLVIALFLFPIISVDMKIYSQPGTYILKAEDYNYSDNLLVQIWGAGSGSSQIYYTSSSNTWVYYGGNSGAYAMVNVSTLYNETFYLMVGKGGDCTAYVKPWGNMSCACSSSIYNYYGYDGGYSMFYLPDMTLLVNISGGNAYATYNVVPPVADVIKLITRADDTVIYTNKGLTYYKDSPYGAYVYGGGLPGDSSKCNGDFGTGAGPKCNIAATKDSQGSATSYYKGGDGRIIVYY